MIKAETLWKYLQDFRDLRALEQQQARHK